MVRGTDIARAAAQLKAGKLVAFPTETVYGLGADAAQPAAVRAIFAAKGRPANHPLIVHVAEAAQLTAWAREIPQTAWQLAEAFWPGPLTLILRKHPAVPPEVTGGADTIGLRVPAHPMALSLLAMFGGGVAAPSANRFGEVSPTTADHASDLLPALGYLLDGGPCAIGIESTIVDLTTAQPTILRPGGVPREALRSVLGELGRPTAQSPVVSGSLVSHYAPAAKVMLATCDEVPALLARLQHPPAHVVVLAAPRDAVRLAAEPATVHLVPESPEGLAHELYACLRELDTSGYRTIIAIPPPTQGLGEAVLDRLARAAGPRTPSNEET